MGSLRMGNESLKIVILTFFVLRLVSKFHTLSLRLHSRPSDPYVRFVHIFYTIKFSDNFYSFTLVTD